MMTRRRKTQNVDVRLRCADFQATNSDGAHVNSDVRTENGDVRAQMAMYGETVPRDVW